MNTRTKVNSVSPIVVIALFLMLPISAVIAKSEYKAVTAVNVDISIEDLNALLLPLTQPELEVEASAWQDVLSNKVRELGALEIQSRSMNQQAGLLDQVGEQLKGSVEAVLPGATENTSQVNTDMEQEGAKGEFASAAITDTDANPSPGNADVRLSQGAVLQHEADELAAKIATVRLEQGNINKRFDTVLDALETKGGDVKQLWLYSSAVSGIKLNVDDSTAALLAIKEWVMSDGGGRVLLINLVQFIAAIAFVIFLSRMAGRLTDRIVARESVSMLLENFTKVAIRRSVLAIGFIFSLPIIGIDVGPVLALIGAAGLVIGLALQGTLSNFASGVLILIYRPYDMNDAIQAGNVTGIVHSMNLLFTTIKTFDNQLITIPNNNVWNDAIVNITGSQERRVDLVFGIGYGDDFAKAQDILRTILEQHPKVLKTPEPKIRVNELGDSSVNLICRPWAKTEDYWDVYWDVTETVKREFDRQGISIPFPQRDVHFYPAAETPAGSNEVT